MPVWQEIRESEPVPEINAYYHGLVLLEQTEEVAKLAYEALERATTPMVINVLIADEVSLAGLKAIFTGQGYGKKFVTHKNIGKIRIARESAIAKGATIKDGAFIQIEDHQAADADDREKRDVVNFLINVMNWLARGKIEKVRPEVFSEIKEKANAA